MKRPSIAVQPRSVRFGRSLIVLVGFFAGVCALACPAPVFAQARCVQPVARVVSAEGFISVVPISGQQPIPISAEAPREVCAGDSVTAAPRSRAQVVLLASNQTIRINQNTTIRIVAEAPQAPRSVIELLQGIIRLFNPIGRPLDVRTPFVTAGTEGTEFFVAYDPQTEETRTGVIEGVVRLTRMIDSLLLGAGQAAVAPRMGPLQRLDIVPADAVRWSIFYPPAVWTLSPDESGLDPRVVRSWQAWRTGDLQGFTNSLNEIPQIVPPPQPSPIADARSLVRFAALLLIVGQVEEAEAAIAQAEQMRVTTALIPALRSVIAVARNRTDQALALTERAVTDARSGSDQSGLIAATIARSYALQSAFRLPEARAALATVESENDPLVFARLAELDLSLGNNRAARREAQRANELAPALSLTSSILGYAALANFDFAAAETAFARAAAQDPGDPLPHLGLGLVAIRSGNLFSFSPRNLEAGRAELVIAVGLNPDNAVARSYAGRTYAELRLYQDAFREWALAESVDRNDPTAPLYRAFAERALNRPIAALRDIERSIALNDNRAVYRSRLLLDQDLATRTTDLASVYRDLGFEQLALSEGYNSLTVDPGNPGAHRFVSDTYLTLPRHETASDSELLQSLLLQPINVQPVRPRLAREGLGILDLQSPSRIGFNEFSPVFASNGLNLLADAFGGTLGTYGENLVLTGIRENFSASIGQFFYQTDGFRENNQLQRHVEHALVQVALSDRASLLAEFRHSALDAGDIHLFFDPNVFSLTERKTEDFLQYRVGGRFEAAAGITLVAVWTRQLFEGFDDTGLGFSLDGTQNGDLTEAAVYVSRPRFNLVAGAGYFDGRVVATADFFGQQFTIGPGHTTHTNGWAYATASPFESVRLTLGASFDTLSATTTADRQRFSPKLGVAWTIVRGSILRAAYTETLKRSILGQTIEPTQVAGFNQLFDDSEATLAKRWGVGFDQKFGDRLFTGLEWSQRRLNVPTTISEDPIVIIVDDWKEDVGRAYVNWIATDDLSVNVALQWERFVRDPFGFNEHNLADLDLLRIPLELRYSAPSGLLAFVRASFVAESGHFLDTLSSSGPATYGGQDTFVVADAGIGWRLPGRPVMGWLQVKNLFNTDFQFQDTDSTNPSFIPHRLVMGRITVSF